VADFAWSLMERSLKSWRPPFKPRMPEHSLSLTLCFKVRSLCLSVLTLALGLMSLQLLNLGPLFSLGWARIFARTPRGMLMRTHKRSELMVDHAEANAPPMINYGWVYPQALLIFTITLVYSVVSPLILVFGAIYFGVACE
jgi:hypothetical protein